MSAETVPTIPPSPECAVPRVSVREYLDMERRSEVRHEYVDGVIIAMSGESLNHNRIVGNVAFKLNLAFIDRPCDAFVESIRVRVTPTQYRYPDVVALCGDALTDNENPPALLNPSVIFEVLSPSTEKYDREDKFVEYRKIGSLTDYVLIEQDRFSVIHFNRLGPTEWIVREYSAPTDELAFAALDVSLTLADIYRKVTFQSPPADANAEVSA